MRQKKVTCIVCPIGCAVEVELDQENRVSHVRNNRCPKGYDYAVAEATCPTRILTTTVRVRGGSQPLISVRTVAPIPRDKLFAAMDVLRHLEVSPPLKVGEEVISDLVGTGIAVIATRPAERKGSWC